MLLKDEAGKKKAQDYGVSAISHRIVKMKVGGRSSLEKSALLKLTVLVAKVTAARREELGCRSYRS